MGYTPKGMILQQTPAQARQKQVGFILRAGLTLHNQGSYFGLVLHGLHTELAAKGYAAVFIGSEDTLNRARLESFFPTGHSLKGAVMLGEDVQISLLIEASDIAAVPPKPAAKPAEKPASPPPPPPK